MAAEVDVQAAKKLPAISVSGEKRSQSIQPSSRHGHRLTLAPIDKTPAKPAEIPPNTNPLLAKAMQTYQNENSSKVAELSRMADLKGRLLPDGEIPSLGQYIVEGSNINAMQNYFGNFFAEKGNFKVAGGERIAELEKKKIGQHKALVNEDLAAYNELGQMRENDIPIERTLSNKLDDINDQTMFSEISATEKVDISDLWVEDEKEMRRKFQQMSGQAGKQAEAKQT